MSIEFLYKMYKSFLLLCTNEKLYSEQKTAANAAVFCSLFGFNGFLCRPRRINLFTVNGFISSYSYIILFL